MTKVLIGVPCGGTVKAQLLTTVMASVCSMGVEFALMVRESAIGADNRWHMARAAVDNGFTHLWLIDNDMEFQPDTFGRLLAHGKDVVCASYNYRQAPIRTITTLFKEDGTAYSPTELPKELFKCYASGSGCKLVTVEALKRTPQPWFALEWNADGSLKTADDAWFCQQVRKAGMDVWCDPTIEAKHIGDFAY